MNYFAYESAARRYARSRPFFHPLVIAKVRAYLQLGAPLARALDVACGTGQSTRALKAIATRVVGADASRGMLDEAPRDASIEYVESPAEHLPFAARTFDLITVALAFHWLDRAPFLAEAWRVLRPAGWLVIYNNAFTGSMKENPAFERWSRGAYLARYPSPARNSAPFTDEEAMHFGFTFARREGYENRITFSRDELARYLMTQSNVIAAVETGAERADRVFHWLKASIARRFVTPKGTFEFSGTISFLRRSG